MEPLPAWNWFPVPGSALSAAGKRAAGCSPVRSCHICLHTCWSTLSCNHASFTGERGKTVFLGAALLNCCSGVKTLDVKPDVQINHNYQIALEYPGYSAPARTLKEGVSSALKRFLLSLRGRLCNLKPSCTAAFGDLPFLSFKTIWCPNMATEIERRNQFVFGTVLLNTACIWLAGGVNCFRIKLPQTKEMISSTFFWLCLMLFMSLKSKAAPIRLRPREYPQYWPLAVNPLLTLELPALQPRLTMIWHCTVNYSSWNFAPWNWIGSCAGCCLQEYKQTLTGKHCPNIRGLQLKFLNLGTVLIFKMGTFLQGLAHS